MRTFFLLLALAATTASAQSTPQDVPPSIPSPAPSQAQASAPAVSLLRHGSFEAPRVTARTPAPGGGDPTRAPGQPWANLSWLPGPPAASSIILGLTNEAARTGSQSLFVRFNHTASTQAVILTSGFFPVLAGATYQFGLWGRADARDILDGSGRSAYVKLQVDFFAIDAASSVGEPVIQVQPLPGSRDHDPVYTPDSWYQFTTQVPAPPGAVFAQVTLRWETGADPGEANGTFFFDDASFTGPPPPNPDITPAPYQEPPDQPETTGSAAPATTGSASPAASP